MVVSTLDLFQSIYENGQFYDCHGFNIEPHNHIISFRIPKHHSNKVKVVLRDTGITIKSITFETSIKSNYYTKAVIHYE